MNYREHIVIRTQIRGYEVSWNDRLMKWELKYNDAYKTIPCDDKLDKCSRGDDNVNTFDLVEQGDLVCGVDDHSADIRISFMVNKNTGGIV